MDFCVWIICSRPIIIMHAPWVMEFTILPDRPMVIIFSSPELKAQMGFSDRGSSVVLPSVNIFIFFRTTEPILTKLGTMHLWVKEIQVCQMKNHSILIRKILFFSPLNQRQDTIICVDFIHLNCFLRWSIWPMGLLFTLYNYLYRTLVDLCNNMYRPFLFPLTC